MISEGKDKASRSVSFGSIFNVLKKENVATRILIVDDSSAIRQAVRCLIEQRPDWEVCGEADNGQTAIDKFRELSPDFVVLDLSMPVMNGLDAARQISVIDPAVPLLMCTLFQSEQLVSEARKAGIGGVLSKSEGLCSTLVDTIDHMLHP
jgi:DNA-binding NarL/FixJ family response regulator